MTETPVKPAAGRVARVGARGWGRHRSISAGVRAAAPGGVVMVAAGVYRETVVVDQAVQIVAETDGEVRLSADGGPALDVRSGDAHIRGLVVDGDAATGVAVRITSDSAVLE